MHLKPHDKQQMNLVSFLSLSACNSIECAHINYSITGIDIYLNAYADRI